MTTRCLARIIDPLVTPVPIDLAMARTWMCSVNKFGAYASWRSRVTDSRDRRSRRALGQL